MIHILLIVLMGLGIAGTIGLFWFAWWFMHADQYGEELERSKRHTVIVVVFVAIAFVLSLIFK